MKVIAEALPTRCEICHQSDCFDPKRNFCSRCEDVPLTFGAEMRLETPVRLPFLATYNTGRQSIIPPLLPIFGVSIASTTLFLCGWGVFSRQLSVVPLFWLCGIGFVFILTKEARTFIPIGQTGFEPTWEDWFLRFWSGLPGFCLAAMLGAGLGSWFVFQYQPVDVVYKTALNSSFALETVLKLGVNVNARDDFGRTALFFAVKEPPALERLLQAGADIQAQDVYDGTALMEAASLPDATSADMLLEHRANPNFADRWDMTALMYAVKDGSSETVKHLIRYGASANVRNFQGESFLKMARQRRNGEIKRVILKAGLVGVRGLNSKDLIQAVEIGDYESVQFCLELEPAPGKFQMLPRVSPHAVDYDRNITALMLAVWKGDWRMAELLLEAGAPTDYVIYPTGVDAFSLAVYRNDEDMQNLLLWHGAHRSTVNPAYFKEIEKIFQPAPKKTAGGGMEDFNEADMLK